MRLAAQLVRPRKRGSTNTLPCYEENYLKAFVSDTHEGLPQTPPFSERAVASHVSPVLLILRMCLDHTAPVARGAPAGEGTPLAALAAMHVLRGPSWSVVARRRR